MNKKKEKIPKSKYERSVHRRGIGLMVVSYTMAFVLMLLGIICIPVIPASNKVIFHAFIIVSFVVFALAFVANILLKNHEVKKLNQMKVGETQEFIIKHRESAKEIAAEKLAFLQRIRAFTNAYSICLFVMSMLSAFSIGVTYSSTSGAIAGYFMMSILCLCAISRIHFPLPAAIYTEDKTYVSEEEYPELYALAKQAANALRCKGDIKIAILGECNAGIAKMRNIYSVQLGAPLLNVLSKDELYTVLLHEFAHVVEKNAAIEKEVKHNDWICNGGNPNFYSGIISMMYLYPDLIYIFQFSLYQYASSLANETNADQVMATLGEAQCAASALIKIKYYSLFSWEKGTTDEKCFYESESLNKEFLEAEVNEFKSAIPKRKEIWDQLIEDEILARSASHPTLKMRLETLGVSSLTLSESKSPSSYTEECEKAIKNFEELLSVENAEQYKENRKLYYLEPLKLVEKWEKDGKPLVPEEYSDIDQALRKLGRNIDAEALCERAMRELDDAASCYAYFMRGCSLLHSYDATGIDLIYHAIENNSNYIEEGLDVIGEFCCLVGREDDLEEYRRRAVMIAQEKKDVFDEANILRKKDNLTSESLPEQLHDNIYKYITSIEDNQIQKVYLVRKTVTKDFFTSIFVVQFQKNTPTEVRDRVMHKIFSYLDTCSDWQFSLFDYEDVKAIKFSEIKDSCFYSEK